jgi:hypothetical protein
MTENPKWVAVYYYYKQPAPIMDEIKELKHFREICEHFPTDWGYLIEVETGKILDTYHSY